MKWIFSVSSCPDVLSDDGFATKRHCVRSNRQKLPIVRAYYPGILVSIFATSNFVTVFTQSTDFYDDILVSLVSDKYGMENDVLLSG